MRFAILPLLSLLIFPACDGVNRLIDGKDNEDSAVIAAAPEQDPAAAPVNQQRLRLYDDTIGLLGDPDINTLLASGIRSEKTGGAPEGQTYLSISGMDFPFAAMAFTFDRQTLNLVKNLSSFKDGCLHFSMRLTRPLSDGETINLGVFDNISGTPTVPPSAANGFSRTSTGWQTLMIPLSGYGSNFSAVWSPFHMSLDGILSPIGFDLDNIYWQKK